MTGVRLLLAEDEWLIVDRIERALSGSRYDVVAKAANLAEALRLLDTIEFDAAVLDGNLDGIKTWPLAQKLQEVGTPILLLTAYSGMDRRTEIPALAKPFAAQALLTALDLLIDDQ